jgi:hypothetical protein
MNRSEYLSAVNEFFYQGEVLGEAVFDNFVRLEENAERRYKWGTLLQLETETKARLRPFLTQLGLSIVQEDTREKVAQFSEGYASKSWHQHMEVIASVTNWYLDKFREIESAAPESERAVAHSMVLHEAALNKFAQLELAGDTRNSLNDVIAQLQYPLVNPEAPTVARAS